MAFHGMGQDGMEWEWHGMGRDGLAWHGMGRDGTGWDGMGRDGTGWENRMRPWAATTRCDGSAGGAEPAALGLRD